MSCRETSAGSAFVTFALKTVAGELPESAVSSTFHDLKRLYASRDESTRRTYTREEYLALLNRQKRRVERSNLTQARKLSLLERLEAAEQEELPPQDVLYALHNLTPTVRNRREALTNFFTSISTRTNEPVNDIATRFVELQGTAPRTRGRRRSDTTPDYIAQLGIGSDAGVVYAATRLNEEAETFETAQLRNAPQRVVRTILPRNGLATSIRGVRITEVGYDRSRLEITVTDRNTGTTQTFAYHNIHGRSWNTMSRNNYARLSEYWVERIRGNPDYAYANEQEAITDGAAARCSSCGQYAQSGHTCPPRAVPSIITSRSTTSRWSRQTVQILTGVYEWTSSGGYQYGEELRDIRVSLPPVREFRAAVANGPVTVRDLFDSGYEIVADPRRSGSGRSHEWHRTIGEITVQRNAEGTLVFDTSQLQCDCSAYRRNRTCKHVEMFTTAISNRLNSGISSGASPEARAAMIAEQQRRAEAAAVDDWTRNEATLAEASRTWRSQAEVSYSTSPEAFLAAVKAAEERKERNGNVPDIPYMRENALDGMATRRSRVAFGMEIEFEFPTDMPYDQRARAIRSIGQDLYDAGLTYAAGQQNYGASKHRGFRDRHKDRNGVGNWSFERDGSVNGGELVTPAMYDEPETWENLEKAVEIITRHGGVASRKAGAHVHVSTGAEQGSPAFYSELGRMVTQHEDSYFRLASDPKRGTHRKNSYAGGMRPVPPEGFSNLQNAKRWQGGRYALLNLAAVQGEAKDHVEFRLFDSTLIPGAMQAQIKLAVATVHAAKRNAAAGGTARGQEKWGSHFTRNRLRGRRRMTDEELIEDSATTRSLLDTLFRRREDKEQAASIFAYTKWTKK